MLMEPPLPLAAASLAASRRSPLSPFFSSSSSFTLQLEEELQDDLKWSIEVKEILHSGKSDFQSVELVDSGPFGKVREEESFFFCKTTTTTARKKEQKLSLSPILPPPPQPPSLTPPPPLQVLLLDGKAQSAEADEHVYHEMLVHPALVAHGDPRRVFIAGGGEGATAREVLRHASVERLLMVDIDRVVCDFCEEHLPANKAAFADPRLELVCDDAAAQLRAAPDGAFDVIIGDLADPVSGGPCFQLYTREFYENVVKKKLAPGGVFVTQSGPCGVLSATQVFTPINHTLAAVFARVVPMAAHVPSYADTWGWNVAFLDAEEEEKTEEVAAAAAAEEAGTANGSNGNGVSKKSPKRIRGRMPATAEEADAALAAALPAAGQELVFLDGRGLMGALALNKVVRRAIAEEDHVYTVDSP